MRATILLGSATLIALSSVSATAQTLTVSVSGSGKVTGTGIDCPSDCREDFLPTNIGLRAQPRPIILTAGSGRVEWGGVCAGTTGATCSISFGPGGATVSAVFTKEPVTPPPQGQPTLQPTPRAADLVGDIVPLAGNSNSWSVIVQNLSQMDATGDVRVEFYKQGQRVAKKVFTSVPRNSQRILGTLSCALYPGQPGLSVPPGQGGSPVCPWPVGYDCKDSRIVVDVTNVVAESNERNNKYEFCWKYPTTFSSTAQ